MSICLIEQFLRMPEGGITDFPKAVLIVRNTQYIDATKLILKLFVKFWAKEGWITLALKV